ncbi:unnamed protein product, partial [Adineta steineri]
MSTKILIISLFLGLLICLNLAGSAKGETFYENVATACKWLKENVGYGCDNQGERWIWTTYMRLKYGVTDCNSFCQKYHKKTSGQCTSTSNYDTSTWCPQGQTCTC